MLDQIMECVFAFQTHGHVSALSTWLPFIQVIIGPSLTLFARLLLLLSWMRKTEEWPSWTTFETRLLVHHMNIRIVTEAAKYLSTNREQWITNSGNVFFFIILSLYSFSPIVRKYCWIDQNPDNYRLYVYSDRQYLGASGYIYSIVIFSPWLH